MQRAKILSTGMCVPDFVVTNDLLAQVMDTNDAWITKRTGIQERRVIPDTYRMLQQLAQASDKAAYPTISSTQPLIDGERIRQYVGIDLRS